MPSGVYYWRRALRAGAADVAISASTPTARPFRQGKAFTLPLAGTPTNPDDAGQIVQELLECARSLPGAYPNHKGMFVGIAWRIIRHSPTPARDGWILWEGITRTTLHLSPMKAAQEAIDAIEGAADRGAQSAAIEAYLMGADVDATKGETVEIQITKAWIGWIT